jgi:hypothetical protein
VTIKTIRPSALVLSEGVIAQPRGRAVRTDHRAPGDSIHVRARDGQIDGHLEPYWDPDRRCQASATFLGWVDGNRISGTFSSRCVDDTTRILNGHWAAHRDR